MPGATLRHLLAHASGYAPERPMRAAAPGTRRIYSNVGIERAADLVEPTRPTCRSRGTSPRPCCGRCSMARPILPGSPARDGRSSTVADLARVVHELLAPTGLLAAPTLRRRWRRCSTPGCAACCPASARRTRTTGASASRSAGTSRRTGRARQLAAHLRALRPERHDALGRPGRRSSASSRSPTATSARGPPRPGPPCPTPSSPPTHERFWYRIVGIPARSGVSVPEAGLDRADVGGGEARAEARRPEPGELDQPYHPLALARPRRQQLDHL